MTTARAAAKTTRQTPKKWSQHVTETSDAMDLKQDIFKSSDPKKIARSLKSSAEHSDRRKSDPYRSAMSMITFYINRAGENLAARQRKHLEDAKDELRALFGRPAAQARRAAAKAAKKPGTSSKSVAPRRTRSASHHASA